MTGFLDGIVALLVALVLNAVIVSRIRISVRGAEGQFLARLYIAALALRGAGAILLNIYVANPQFAGYFWGDSSTYDIFGYRMALEWRGEAIGVAQNLGNVSGYGFVYLVAALYLVFGRNQLLAQLTNATIGCLSILVIYGIARRLFSEREARWAALFMAFFPQMIFWSCAIYKDPSILLCISLAMYSLLRLRDQLTPGLILLFVASVLALLTLRFYIFYMVVFATMGTFLISQRRGVLSGLLAQLLVGGALAAALVFGIRQEVVKQQTSYFDLDKLQISREGQIQVGRSDFGADFDVSTPAGAVAAIPVGLVYLLFAPFPWAISGVRQVLTLPETLVWYALMPALFRGLVHTARHRFRAVLPILTFAAVLTVAYAVFQSNVGTAYRQRTQISMFFFIFMGVGIELKRRRREARAFPVRGGGPLRQP
jgi:4-amino-4-deoxy-L-arabinose transferase-like glycosyltransferase